MNPGNDRRMQENVAGAIKFRQLATPTNLIRQPGQKGTPNELWPVRLSSTHPMDEQMALRAAVVKDNGVVPGMGIATVGQNEFNYQADKLADAEEAAYKQWVMANIDLSSPASQQWYYKTIPWLKTDREAEVDRVSELQKQWAKILMNGPQSDDDFRMIYAFEQGILKIPDQPVHKLNTMTASEENGFAKDYKGGFFSIWARDTTESKLPMTSVPFQIPWGQPDSKTTPVADAGIWTSRFASKPLQLFTGKP